MRNRIYELLWNFEEISEQITDIKTVLKLYEGKLRENSEELRTQSILRGQIRQLELAKKDCEQFTERIDELLRDYLHGRIETIAKE